MFLIIIAISLILISILLTKNRSRRVFLVNFSCYKPPEIQKCSREALLDGARRQGYPGDLLSFTAGILRASGVGDSTYVPQNILSCPPDLSTAAERSESETVVFGAVDALLGKTKVDSREIGIVIVNCTVYNPVPSLCSVIVNRYKMKDDVRCYNLSGMGCSASLLAVGLANKLLKVHKNTCALVVSTENTTAGVYTGADPSKIIINTMFRSGGSAILLSNKPTHRRRSNYELLQTAHTNAATSDVAYSCIHREEDSAGITGITTTKNLLIAASSAVEQHVRTLGFLFLPLSEQFLIAKNYIDLRLRWSKSEAYFPKFNRCTDHFLPHVGAKPVQDAVQKKLGFGAGDLEASRMTLYRFGNTSSCSIWYELAYVEVKGRVKKGNRVWQIAYGSGFKCSSVIMRALKDVEGDDMNPWMSEIGGYPVDLDTLPTSYLTEPTNMQ